MKTREPVDDETAARIGKAYVVCSQYPEIFGDVKMSKFCGMFVDVIDDDEDEREARMRKVAPEMYKILCRVDELCEKVDLDSDTEEDIRELLALIDGKEVKEW